MANKRNTTELTESPTPMSDAIECTRASLGQARTPAYGDALRMCRKLERQLHAKQAEQPLSCTPQGADANLSLVDLKLVPPVEADPVILDRDKPWSDVFILLAKRFEENLPDYGLCRELSLLAQAGVMDLKQARRMTEYIMDLLTREDCVYAEDWIELHNGVRPHKPWMRAYRAAWSRHLANQFRAAGL